MTTLETVPEPPEVAVRQHDLRRRRLIGMSIWTAALLIFVVLVGFPSSDPLEAFGWLWTATIAWRSHLPRKQHLVFLRDWLPIIVLLEVYNLSRGQADKIFAPHVYPMIHADTWMTGWFTGGKVPTVWLQEHLYTAGHTPWWMFLPTIVYLSHFVTVPTVAVVLWMRDRERSYRFIRRWIALTAAGLLTYFLYPAAPPWWASQYGQLHDTVYRLSSLGLNAVGLHSAGNTLNLLQADQSNDVAAMPSLHTAYAMLAVAFFLPVVRRRWWPVLLAYPLAMTFTLIFTGEHYLTDVLVGWAYVALVFIGVGLGERWWARRKGDSARAVADSGVR